MFISKSSKPVFTAENAEIAEKIQFLKLSSGFLSASSAFSAVKNLQ